MATTDDALTELLAERAIHEVLTRYARAADHFDLDLMRSCYWPGANDWHGSFRGPIEDFIPWVEGRLNEYSATRHHLSNVRIEFEDGGRSARVESYVFAYHNLPAPHERELLFLGLRYIDRFEKRDGEWRIGDRVCAYDWRYEIQGTESGLTDLHLRGSRGPDDPLNWIMDRHVFPR